MVNSHHIIHHEVLAVLCLLVFAACRQAPVKAPVAEIVPKDVTVHNDKRTDNYFWLRERDEQRVIDYLEAENAYTEAMMKEGEGMREGLFKELVGRIRETDLEVPAKWGDYFYYTRSEEGKQYKIFCRKKGHTEAPEEILLDQNLLAQGKGYFKLGVTRVSPDHELLAYSVDSTGAETYDLFIKNIATGELYPDRIPNTSNSVEWANDNRTIYYNILDETRRPFKVLKHILGTAVDQDELVHFEEDDAYFASVEKSKDERFIFLELNSNITSEIWYLDANAGTSRFRILQPRQRTVEYHAEHHKGSFYIMTNEDAINFKLLKTAVKSPARRNWQEIIPHREGVKLDGFDLFENHLAVYEREKGREKIRVIDLTTNEMHYVEFEEPAFAIQTTANPEFNTNVLRFKYSSLVTPEAVFDYNLTERTRELKKQEEVLGGYDPSLYTSERIFARASDGVEIPISLVYRKDTPRNGTSPLLLYGYGSYGITVDPTFSSNRLSLLDRGFVYAIAHIRGGGLLGRPWYEDGKILKKKNTFTDFISVAEHLIQRGYAAKDKVIIYGGSAGGLLVGAVLNMRPDLWRAAIAKVPFVDVLNTMLDETIPLTVIEYEEWGNPNDLEYYEYIKSYSPYDNVEAKNYPDILITAGLNDPRVQYWEPAKWTAKLRALKTDNNMLLLKTFMGAGHSGSSGRYERLKDIAFDYAFIFDRLGISL